MQSTIGPEPVNISQQGYWAASGMDAIAYNLAATAMPVRLNEQDPAATDAIACNLRVTAMHVRSNEWSPAANMPACCDDQAHIRRAIFAASSPFWVIHSMMPLGHASLSRSCREVLVLQKLCNASSADLFFNDPMQPGAFM